MKNVTVILPETLMGIGLKQLIVEAFGFHVALISTFEQLSQPLVDDSQFFITTDHIFLDHLDFFLPNKDKTLLVTPSVSTSQQVHHVDITGSEESIIAQLAPYFNSDAEDEVQARLTQRETAVLKLVVEGCINKEIAERLNISINTVLSHRKNITAKLGIKSVSGLSVYAIMNGIVSPKSL